MPHYALVLAARQIRVVRKKSSMTAVAPAGAAGVAIEAATALAEMSMRPSGCIDAYISGLPVEWRGTRE